jgi:hypothetical protein
MQSPSIETSNFTNLKILFPCSFTMNTQVDEDNKECELEVVLSPPS